jgi:hypothetical protein
VKIAFTEKTIPVCAPERLRLCPNQIAKKVKIEAIDKKNKKKKLLSFQ